MILVIIISLDLCRIMASFLGPKMETLRNKPGFKLTYVKLRPINKIEILWKSV